MSALASRIKLFFDVFRGYVEEVEAVQLDQSARRHRKVMYFTLLEALAKARYPRRRADRAFACFVSKYCSWPDAEKASLPHLVAVLERTDDDRFEAIRQQVFRRFQWGSGGPKPLKDDLARAEVQRLWPSENGVALPVPELGIYWNDVLHRRLIYAYRSKLVHESREPTVSFENRSDEEPFYESVQEGRGGPTNWHLVYPAGFLGRLCSTGIQSLETYFSEEARDPYDSFQFGIYLLEKLNDEERYPLKVKFAVSAGA